MLGICLRSLDFIDDFRIKCLKIVKCDNSSNFETDKNVNWCNFTWENHFKLCIPPKH